MREGSWEVSFVGIDSIDDAEALVGSFCLAAAEDLPDVSADEAPALLLGYTVEDSSFGPLGTVSDVLESAAQATLFVTGEQGEVLIPFVEEFVEVVDEAASAIRTRIPQGLLDLNRTAPGDFAPGTEESPDSAGDAEGRSVGDAVGRPEGGAVGGSAGDAQGAIA